MKRKTDSFRIEIGCVLILKVILILSLKAMFFSDSSGPDPGVSTIQTHFFNTRSPVESNSNQE